MLEDRHYKHFEDMVHRCMGDSVRADCIEDRVIAIETLRAACTNYLAEHHPDNWGQLGEHISRVIQHGERKKANKKTLFG